MAHRSPHDAGTLSQSLPPGVTFSEAAVALVVSQQERSILLIRRADHPQDPWSGHMALPGGRRDPGDDTTLWTAVRESQEEVGLDLTQAPLLFQLPPLPAHSRRKGRGVLVTAYAFLVESECPTFPNEEVAEVHWIPLELLESGALNGFYELREKEPGEGARVVKMPAFHYEGRVIWGVTHRILERFLRQLAETAGDPPSGLGTETAVSS